MELTPFARRVAFLALAGTGLLAMVLALLVILLADSDPLPWLVLALFVAVAAIVGEVVILLLEAAARQRARQQEEDVEHTIL